jgi:hypothetical protein
MLSCLFEATSLGMWRWDNYLGTLHVVQSLPIWSAGARGKVVPSRVLHVRSVGN